MEQQVFLQGDGMKISIQNSLVPQMIFLLLAFYMTQEPHLKFHI